MVDNDKRIRDEDKRDAKAMASLLQNTHADSKLQSYTGIALSSYMNGFFDAYRSFKAAIQPAV